MKLPPKLWETIEFEPDEIVNVGKLPMTMVQHFINLKLDWIIQAIEVVAEEHERWSNPFADGGGWMFGE